MKKIVQRLKQASLALLLALIPFTIWGAQGSVVIPDGTGAQVLTNINTANQVLITNNSGASEPSTTYAYQLWADTTAGVMKQRNAANSAWITLYTLATPDTGKTLTTTTLSGTTTAGAINAGALSGTTGSFSGTLSSTKACASGYTRAALNYCVATNGLSYPFQTGNITSTTCLASTALTGVSDATAVMVEVDTSIYSAGGIALRYANGRIFDATDTGCALTASAIEHKVQIREFASVTTGTIIYEKKLFVIVKSSSTGVFRYQGQSFSGNGSGYALAVIGYFD